MSNDKNKDEIGQPPTKVGQPPKTGSAGLCQSIDWYAEGQTRIVEVNGVRVEIRLVGRQGRRARIAITAPPGTVFLDPTAQSVSE